MGLNLDDFHYDLPEGHIAKHPPQHRGGSRLLFYDSGTISHHSFAHIVDLIPDHALLVFNDTKVIPARIILHKETGAKIEIFLLVPLLPSKVHEEVMNAAQTCTWKCLIGNAKKWKEGSSLKHGSLNLAATRTGEDRVQFEWDGKITFSDLLAEIGKIPLPPYIDREAGPEDEEYYRTVYSRINGAVAAPTAGLHFTEEIITELEAKGVQTDYLTLHVSAGTFQPIKTDDIAQHHMHNEQVWISKATVEHLLQAGQTIAVGTTAMRTLESLYWFGAKLRNGQDEFFIRKKDPYEFEVIPKEEVLKEVLRYMEERQLEKIGGHTEIFLYPGYTFRICEGLVTNYHLPGSTLILLIAAFIGEDWKKVYREALDNDYRFLSYGDSSLLLR